MKFDLKEQFLFQPKVIVLILLDTFNKYFEVSSSIFCGHYFKFWIINFTDNIKDNVKLIELT